MNLEKNNGLSEKNNGPSQESNPREGVKGRDKHSETFEADRVISEGQEGIEKAVKNTNIENREVIAQIGEYSGAKAGDIENAGGIISEANQEIDEVKKGVNEKIGEIEGAEVFEEYQKLQSFIEDAKKQGSEKKGWELALDFLQITKKDYDNDPIIKRHFDKLTSVPGFKKIQESSYVKDNYDSLSVDEYIDKKGGIEEAARKTDYINDQSQEFVKKQEKDKSFFNSEYNLENLSIDDTKKIKELVKKAKFEGLSDQQKLEGLLDKGIISSDDVLDCLTSQRENNKIPYFQSLANFSDSFIKKLNIAKKLEYQANDELESAFNPSESKVVSSVIFNKIIASEMLNKTEKVRGYFKVINDKIIELNNQNDPALINSFFSQPNERLFSRNEVNKEALKSLFLKYVDNCRNQENTLKQGGLNNILKAKQRGFISEEEFKMIYPQKI